MRERAELLAAFSALETSSEAEGTGVLGSNILLEYLHIYHNLYFQGLWWKVVATTHQICSITKSSTGRNVRLSETVAFGMDRPSGCGLRKPTEDLWPLGAATESFGKHATSELGWLGCQDMAGTAMLWSLKCLSLGSTFGDQLWWSSHSGLAIGGRHENRIKKENVMAGD